MEWEGEFKGIKAVRKKRDYLENATKLSYFTIVPTLRNPSSITATPPQKNIDPNRGRVAPPVRVDTLNSGRHFTILRQLLLALWSENHVHLLAIELGHKLHTCKLLQVIGEAQQ